MKQQVTLEPIEYLYRPMYRPAHFSAMPKDIKWDYIEAPACDPMIAVRRNLPLSRHQFGIIACDRMLTKQERDDYQIDLA